MIPTDKTPAAEAAEKIREIVTFWICNQCPARERDCPNCESLQKVSSIIQSAIDTELATATEELHAAEQVFGAQETEITRLRKALKDALTHMRTGWCTACGRCECNESDAAECIRTALEITDDTN